MLFHRTVRQTETVPSFYWRSKFFEGPNYSRPHIVGACVNLARQHSGVQTTQKLHMFCNVIISYPLTPWTDLGSNVGQATLF